MWTPGGGRGALLRPCPSLPACCPTLTITSPPASRTYSYKALAQLCTAARPVDRPSWLEVQRSQGGFKFRV